MNEITVKKSNTHIITTKKKKMERNTGFGRTFSAIVSKKKRGWKLLRNTMKVI